jgi:hypothetical protein
MYSIALSIFALGQAALTKPVEHPFHMTDSAMIVDAKVNGQDASFMFDTGYSGVIIIDPSVNIGKPTRTITLRDFVGTMEAQNVAIKQLELGPLKVATKDMEATQFSQGNMSLSYGVHCDGIMGLSAVMNYVTEINFQNKKFIFHPKSVDITKRKPDNDKTFLCRLLPKGGDSMEMRVELAPGKRTTLALDTGNAFFATTHKDVLEDHGLWQPGKKALFPTSAGVASGSVDTFYLYMKDVNIYGVPVKESVWSIIDLPTSDANHGGTVGFQFLKNFNVTIDMERRYVWLERFTDSVSYLPWADVGIAAGTHPDRKRVTIFQVIKGGPADKAGLKWGDDILSIDGEDPELMSWKKLSEKFKGKVGTTIKLTTSRDGVLTNHELKREYLINNAPTN